MFDQVWAAFTPYCRLLVDAPKLVLRCLEFEKKNKEHIGTSASLLVTRALLLVANSY